MPQQESLPLNEWLVSWMKEKSGKEIDPNENFIEQEAIDSYNVIELVVDTEREFEIRFEARDFQDRRFVTLSGLSEIIDERVRLRDKGSI